VVQRLRASVRKDPPKRERCDLREVLREAASLIAAEVRNAGVALHLDLDARLSEIEMDRIQIEQVVLNLLRNALEAVTAGAPSAHAIRLEAVAADDGGAEVRVRDDGVGLPAGEAEKLFEPFLTTKPHGLGMGLAISQRIVEAHGGKLRAFANPDGGATFAFTLPARTRPMLGPVTPGSPARSTGGGGAPPRAAGGRARGRARSGAA
jgi:C4-dicarboxylate-specific signal transduction histidine kinase